jgi:hypothetical protein
MIVLTAYCLLRIANCLNSIIAGWYGGKGAWNVKTPIKLRVLWALRAPCDSNNKILGGLSGTWRLGGEEKVIGDRRRKWQAIIHSE